MRCASRNSPPRDAHAILCAGRCSAGRCQQKGTTELDAREGRERPASEAKKKGLSGSKPVGDFEAGAPTVDEMRARIALELPEVLGVRSRRTWRRSMRLSVRW